MSPEAIAALLAAQMDLQIDLELATKLSAYLKLLLYWNARTNLSAIRDPEAIVLRHFGESLQCAYAVPAGVKTMLDYGAGGGFPGAICALARPGLSVVMAESQNKKAAFLQELCRTLPVQATVHAGRVEAIALSLRFDAITLRGVDHMAEACLVAKSRIAVGGWLILMTTQDALQTLAPTLANVAWQPSVAITGTKQSVIATCRILVATSTT